MIPPDEPRGQVTPRGVACCLLITLAGTLAWVVSGCLAWRLLT